MTYALGKIILAVSMACAIGVSGCASNATSFGTKVDDTAITAKVKTALLADPDVKGQSVTVETVNGVVQLSGFVGSSAMAARAADIARRTDGVRQVQNKMTVQ